MTQQEPRKTGWRPGFTLLELSLVFGLLSILGGLTIHGFASYRREAQSQEAVGNLQALYSLEAGRPGGPLACPPWPSEVPDGPVAWGSQEQYEDLGFAIRGQTRFQYEVVVEEQRPGSPTHFAVIARGDLDRDGEYSEFRMSSRDAELRVSRPLE